MTFQHPTGMPVAVKGAAKSAVTILAATAGIGAATAFNAYAHARHYVLRRRTVHIISSSVSSSLRACSNENIRGNAEVAEHSYPSQELSILHFSDFHALARHRKLRKFIRSLRQRQPDMLIFTGDFISENAAIPEILAALEDFRGIPGFFVFGSNDYFKPKPRNPFAYLVRNSNEKASKPFRRSLPVPDTPRSEKPRLNTDDLAAGLSDLGFIDLTNTRARIEVCGVVIDAVGVDDPHIHRDHYPPAGNVDNYLSLNADVRECGKHLRIGVTHAPYIRVLDRMAAEGCSLIFAGHTHGGQICLPGHRALVTNCDLPKHLASGLFAWPPRGIAAIKGDAEVGIASGAAADAHIETLSLAQTWVQVSAGLGTNPFVPLRTWCAPEAIEMRVHC